jgi:hypothetical protein
VARRTTTSFCLDVVTMWLPSLMLAVLVGAVYLGQWYG